jgi:hypothetical protein
VLADSVVPIVLEKQDLIKYVAFDLRDGLSAGRVHVSLDPVSRADTCPYPVRR